MSPRVVRLPLLFMGFAALAFGVLGGLARLGWTLPSVAASQAAVHGALMISAFFGTVISLERAVALGDRWAYGAPALAGIGGLSLLLGAPHFAAVACLVGASSVLLAASVRVIRRQPAVFTWVLATGALCWLLGNLSWLAAANVAGTTSCWLAFLIITIAGERLELTRFLPTPPMARHLFLAIQAVILAGMLLAFNLEAAGLTLFAAGLLALALWLARFDIARRNVHATGMTRFIAVCLLLGYGWLAAGAGLGTLGAFQPGHPWRDAALHAITLGFVFSMVIGHAPIVFPAVARIRIDYRPVLYLPLIALHLSVMLRFSSGMAGDFSGLRLGGAANAGALVAFIATMAFCVLRTKAKKSP